MRSQRGGLARQRERPLHMQLRGHGAAAAALRGGGGRRRRRRRGGGVGGEALGKGGGVGGREGGDGGHGGEGWVFCCGVSRCVWGGEGGRRTRSVGGGGAAGDVEALALDDGFDLGVEAVFDDHGGGDALDEGVDGRGGGGGVRAGAGFGGDGRRGGGGGGAERVVAEVLARDVEGHGGVAALVAEGGAGVLSVPAGRAGVGFGRRGDGVVVDGEEVEERGEGVLARLVAQLEGVEGGALLDGCWEGGLRRGELEGLGVEVAEVGGVGDLGSSAGGRGRLGEPGGAGCRSRPAAGGTPSPARALAVPGLLVGCLVGP